MPRPDVSSHKFGHLEESMGWPRVTAFRWFDAKLVAVSPTLSIENPDLIEID
jgi:hypothetical protein